MTRPLTRHLLLLAVLLHLPMDAAAAGELVVCIGSNDHLAIELAHGGEPDCDSSGGIAPSGAGLPADCTDVPLHPDMELASAAPDAKKPPLVDAPPSPPPIASPHLSLLGLRAIHSAPFVAPGLLAQRTTVLRL